MYLLLEIGDASIIVFNFYFSLSSISNDKWYFGDHVFAANLWIQYCVINMSYTNILLLKCDIPNSGYIFWFRIRCIFIDLGLDSDVDLHLDLAQDFSELDWDVDFLI